MGVILPATPHTSHLTPHMKACVWSTYTACICMFVNRWDSWISD